MSEQKADIVVYADGGARGNPGHAAYGFVIQNKAGDVLHKEGKYIGITTNNVAEYTGLVSALQWIKEHVPTHHKSVTIFLDSQLVVSQMNGTYRVKDEKLKKLFFTAKGLEQSFAAQIQYCHIPRAKNALADFLVNQALDAILKK